MSDSRPKLDISVVIPLYNEQDNVLLLNRELEAALSELAVSYEIVYVNDGSQDDTLPLLREIARKDARIKVISFTRNFGQTAAISAGFRHSRGEIVVTLDGDLQNSPKDIGLLLEKMNEGYDVVSGWRRKRKDPFLSRRLPSMAANALISKITGVRLHDYGCTLKAYRRHIVGNLNLYGEMHRFIPALAGWLGASIAEIEVTHAPRKFGKSKYGFDRTFRVILDLINVKFLISYSTRPIQLFGKIGLYSFFLSLFSLGFVVWAKLTQGIKMANNPLLFLSILLVLVGVQFITIGLLGEINIRTYHEAQGKPIYIIKEILNDNPKP